MPYFRTENSNAENIKYDDTKNVKEVIDDIKDTAMFIDSFDTDTGTLNTTSVSVSSSSDPTASSVTFDNTDTGLAAVNVQDAIEEVNGKLDQVDSNIADTGWQSVTFNSEYQKNIGSISSITNGKITNYKQIKSVDLITTAHINVNVASNNNLYLHPSNSSELTDTFEYRLRIHY